MLDAHIDLCGELVEDAEDNFPVIADHDTFSFACGGCGDCCRQREDIVLSGYDLFRISRRLGLPPALTANAFCRQYMGSVSLLPVMRLAPRDDRSRSCPFLWNDRCSIHEDKPLVCALYPLGQSIEKDGHVEYFLQPIDCCGRIFEARLSDYLTGVGIRQREALDVEWAFTCMRLTRKMKALRESGGLPVLKAAQNHARRALYLDYDPAQPFEPQFQKNLEALECRLEKLSAIHRR